VGLAEVIFAVLWAPLLWLAQATWPETPAEKPQVEQTIGSC
jgi:hypothetical protein